jgi:hypothetical protein
VINKMEVNLLVKLFGNYRHYKGDVYTVIGLGIFEETSEGMVAYVSQSNPEQLWFRRSSVFLEHVEVDGVKKNRFELIDLE